MAYNKIGWLDNKSPYINQANLRKMDNGIYSNSAAIAALSMGETMKGEWTPTAGTEYPLTPSEGDSYYIGGLSSPYLFTDGGLSGETTDNQDKILYTLGGWVMLEAQNIPTDIVKYVDTITDMAGVDINIYTSVIVREGRGGVFNYDPARIAENDGGTVFNGWVRQYAGAVFVKWFDIQTFAELKTMVEEFGGKTIDFEDTIFTFDMTGSAYESGIEIASNTILLGNGCIINTHGTSGINAKTGDLFIINGSSHIKISGFKIYNTSNYDMTTEGERGLYHCILLRGGNSDYETIDIHIFDNYFEGISASTIASRSDTVDPQLTKKMRDIKVTNNTFNKSGGHCVTFAHVENGLVQGNSSSDHQGLNFGTGTLVIVGLFCDISHGCLACIVDNNLEDGCIHGIKSQTGGYGTSELEPSDKHIFSNNIFRNFSSYGSGSANQYGIQIAGNSTTVSNNIIHAGIDKKTGIETTSLLTGIVVLGYSVNFKIEGNDIASNSKGIHHSLTTGKEDTYGLILGNVVYMAIKGTCIHIQSHYGDIIEGNTLQGRHADDITLWIAGGGIVSNNVIYGGTSINGSIYLNITASGDKIRTKIIGNTIYGGASTTAPIFIPSSTSQTEHVDIKNNTITTETSSTAVLLRTDTDSDMHISGNLLSSVMTEATGVLRISGNATGAIVTDNKIIANYSGGGSLNYAGISIDTSENIISNNNITSYGVAVRLGGDHDIITSNVLKVESSGSEISGLGANSIDNNNIKTT